MAGDLSALIAEALNTDDGPALAFDGRWRPRSWLADVSRRLDETLAHHGVGPGGRVGLVARNRPGPVAAMAGLMATHRTTSMIYSAQSPTAIAADVKRLAAAALLADPLDWTAEVRAAAEATGAL